MRETRSPGAIRIHWVTAFQRIIAWCSRLDVDRDKRLIEIMNALHADELLDDLFEASEPDWKRRKLGSYRKEAPLINSANKERIEKLIMDS
jgi:hypothetical protein